MPGNRVGWDLGGAHLKAALIGAEGDVRSVRQVACPLWQGIDRLDQAMDELGADFLEALHHAVTMTGEMVDTFPSRADGVLRLLDYVEARLAGTRIDYLTTDGQLVPAAEARRAPLSLASANWMATALLLARRGEAAILVDVGSTTVDLIPVKEGKVLARGCTDADRLVTGELVYTGAVRTPLMAVTREVEFEGRLVPLMAEYFATTADVHRLTGELPPEADLHPAADGGEKTQAASARRLARMIGRDVESAPMLDWVALAAGFAEIQVRQLEAAVRRVLERPELPGDVPMIVAGVGRFLASEVGRRIGCPTRDFSELVEVSATERTRASDCAPAVAVGLLAMGPRSRRR